MEEKVQRQKDEKGEGIKETEIIAEKIIPEVLTETIFTSLIISFLIELIFGSVRRKDEK